MTRVPAAARAAQEARRSQRRRMRWILSSIGALVVAAALTIILIYALSPAPPLCVRVGPSTIGKKKFPAPPCMALPPLQIFYHAHLFTSMGEINLMLDPGVGPKSVNNFIFLAKTHFYDGLVFHRVENAPDHALVQTGDPTGTGFGGPGYTYDEAPSPETQYNRGVVAMANPDTPKHNGSQFFIIVRTYKALAEPQTFPNYAFFGVVEDDASLAVLDRMVGVPLNGTHPVTPITLIRVTVDDPGPIPSNQPT